MTSKVPEIIKFAWRARVKCHFLTSDVRKTYSLTRINGTTNKRLSIASFVVVVVAAFFFRLLSLASVEWNGTNCEIGKRSQLLLISFSPDGIFVSIHSEQSAGSLAIITLAPTPPLSPVSPNRDISNDNPPLCHLSDSDYSLLDKAHRRRHRHRHKEWVLLLTRSSTGFSRWFDQGISLIHKLLMSWLSI